jgi:hypothetical protein
MTWTDIKARVTFARAWAAHHRALASKHRRLLEGHVHMGRRVAADEERASLSFHDGLAEAYEQQAKALEKSEATVDHSYAPRFVITCGGTSEAYWCDTQEEIDSKVAQLEQRYSGSGIFPMISVMETKVVAQRRVDA